MGHYSNDTINEKSFTHLTKDERVRIEAGIKYGASKSEIACELGRSKSTISREVARGSCIQMQSGKEKWVYLADLGQARYIEARKNCGAECKAGLPFVKEVDNRMAEMRENKIKAGPDGFVGELAASGEYGQAVSTRSIYSYIEQGLLEKTKVMDLPLKAKRRRRKPKGEAKPRENKRVLGESIENRPEAANSREEFGHWEADLVEGKKEGKGEAVLVMAERQTRQYIARRISGTGARAAEEGLDAVIEEYGPAAFKSIAFDNGSEFSGMSLACEAYGITAYFCHPYSSFEKPTVERHNGMLRLAVPKGAAIEGIGEGVLVAAEIGINSLPRKILGYKTPEALFEAELDRLYSLPG